MFTKSKANYLEAKMGFDGKDRTMILYLTMLRQNHTYIFLQRKVIMSRSVRNID